MEKILCKILASFKVLSYKIHVLHTEMQWDILEFEVFHSFLGELYEYFQWKIDTIMEDMEQLKYDVPYCLDEILEESEIEELTSSIKLPKDQLPLVSSDLLLMIKLLQSGIVKSGIEMDLVIQNNLVDYQKDIRKFQWKIRRMMWQK